MAFRQTQIGHDFGQRIRFRGTEPGCSLDRKIHGHVINNLLQSGGHGFACLDIYLAPRKHTSTADDASPFELALCSSAKLQNA